jgi:hypothetical protein
VEETVRTPSDAMEAVDEKSKKPLSTLTTPEAGINNISPAPPDRMVPVPENVNVSPVILMIPEEGARVRSPEEVIMEEGVGKVKLPFTMMGAPEEGFMATV